MKQIRTSRSKRKAILTRQAALRYIRSALLANPDIVRRAQQAQLQPANPRRPPAKY